MLTYLKYTSVEPTLFKKVYGTVFYKSSYNRIQIFVTRSINQSAWSTKTCP